MAKWLAYALIGQKFTDDKYSEPSFCMDYNAAGSAGSIKDNHIQII
jgi:hypothetical protein